MRRNALTQKGVADVSVQGAPVTPRIRKHGAALVHLQAQAPRHVKEVAVPKGRHPALCLSKHLCCTASRKDTFSLLFLRYMKTQE